MPEWKYTNKKVTGENMSVKEEIHAQIVGALKGAKFPIETPEKLISAFPDGANCGCNRSKSRALSPVFFNGQSAFICKNYIIFI